MSRKEPSFEALLAYLHRGRIDERFQFYHNLYSRKVEAVKREFVENAGHLRKRQGGVYLYHEILSIKKCARLSEFRQKEILQEIAQRYVLSRSQRSLVYGVLHDEHVEHLHYHLVISANEAGSAERIRLSKAEFAQVKTQLEAMVQQLYPELEQGLVMSQPAKGEKLSRKGGELKRRTGKTPERDDLKARLHRVLSAEDRAKFFELLAVQQIRVYVRGQSIGFEDLKTGRKHRLKTLGLEAEFSALNARIEQTLANGTQKPSEQGDTIREAQSSAEGQQRPTAGQGRKLEEEGQAEKTADSGLSDDTIQQAREQLESEAREQAAREALRAAQAARSRVEARHAQERRKSHQKAEKGQEPSKAQTAEATTSSERASVGQTDTQTADAMGEAAVIKEAMQEKTVKDKEASTEEAIQKAIEQRRRELAALRSQQGPEASHERTR